MATYRPIKTHSLTRQERKPFQPAIGHDLGPVDEVEAKTRGFIAKAVIISSATSIAVAGSYSLFSGNSEAVMTVWAIVGPIIGALVSYYFGPKRDNTG